MSNLDTKMIQTSIEINGKLNFLKLLETLYTILNAKQNIFQIKIFEDITLFPLMISGFIKFKLGFRFQHKSIIPDISVDLQN